MGVSMLTFSLHALVTLQTQMIQNTSICLCLGGHIVRLSSLVCFVNFVFNFFHLITVKVVSKSYITILNSNLPFGSAVVTYLPKSNVDKKRSLLGDTKGTDEAKPVTQACPFCLLNFLSFS